MKRALREMMGAELREAGDADLKFLGGIQDIANSNSAWHGDHSGRVGVKLKDAGVVMRLWKEGLINVSVSVTYDKGHDALKKAGLVRF